jgi:AcrR family transcriptional regulator
MKATSDEPDPRVARSQARVLDAVAALLITKGTGGVTVDAVMALSGVARATVYRHWPSRRALVLAGLNHLLPHAPPVVEAPGGPVAERLTAYLTGIARQLTEESWAQAIPALLEEARRDPEIRQATTRFIEERKAPLHAVLQEAVKSGELPALDLQLASAELIGPLAYRRLLTSEPVDAALCSQIAADFLRAHALPASRGQGSARSH